MRVEATQQADLYSDHAEAGAETPHQDKAAQCGRALVVVEPSAPAAPRPTHRDAPFLAQLIATREQAPQTRARRRAEPSEAISAYRCMAALPLR